MNVDSAQEMFQFGERVWLFALWLVPALVLVLAVAGLRRRAALLRFVEVGLLGKMNRRVSPGRRVVKSTLVVLALAASVVALARPRWDPQPIEVRGEGRDVCFVIDVSRSMLAQDVATSAADRPTRLERTKLWMMDVVESLRGDRVALVAFAGTPVVKCPLTQDYGFFGLALEDLSPDSVSRGGTMVGDAVRLTLDEVFDLQELEGEDGPEGLAPRYRDIILITDGEDQGSLPVKAAERAGELGVRIITIGIGSVEGNEIPYTDDRGRTLVVRDADGNPVISRLDTQTLERMARATPNGSYLEVAEGTIELDQVYRQLVRAAAHNESARGEASRYREGFQYLLGAALLLLVVESLVGERRRGRET